MRSVKRTLDRVSKALGYFPTVGVIADGLLNATQQPFSTIGLSRTYAHVPITIGASHYGSN